MRLPLIGGAYQARSNIASCTRCINLFPEKNPPSAIVPMTYYQRPGLLPLGKDPANLAPVRCLYRATNGNGYCVIGQSVYAIAPDWTLTKLGTLTLLSSIPCKMADNGIQILLVDSSAIGYTINLIDNTFSPITAGEDPDGFFQAGATVDFIDTFLLWSVPGTKQFKSTLSNQITPFDDTYVASKTDYADPLEALVVNRHEILLIGALKAEIWYDAGNAQFPFAELPGAYVEHGTCAPYSIASADISVFWLSQDLQGVGYVVRQRGYETTLISNHALSVAIRKMNDVGTISDAIGYTYTQDGHAFYVLHFPSGNQTWVFDDAVGDPDLAWHQECWTDADGNLNRHRGNCAAFLYGKNVVGDWQNGTIYAMDLNTYTDTVAGTVYPCSYIRTFQHVGLGQTDSQGVPATALGHMVQYKQFIADMQCGEGPGGPAGPDGVPTPDKISLRWSDNRGKTWGQAILQSNGVPGEFITQPKWGQAGAARDRIFELSHSIAGPAAINGAWVDAVVQGN